MYKFSPSIKDRFIFIFILLLTWILLWIRLHILVNVTRKLSELHVLKIEKRKYLLIIKKQII